MPMIANGVQLINSPVAIGIAAKQYINPFITLVFFSYLILRKLIVKISVCVDLLAIDPPCLYKHIAIPFALA